MMKVWEALNLKQDAKQIMDRCAALNEFHYAALIQDVFVSIDARIKAIVEDEKNWGKDCSNYEVKPEIKT